MAGVGLLAVGAAIGTAAVAGYKLLDNLGKNADRLLDLSAITGMSTDALQRWESVAVIAGVSTEAMSNASQKFTKSLDTMSTGTGKGVDALNSLGLSFDDISNMTADQRMDTLTNALAGVEDTTERAKLGTDLFGGSWKEIAPIIDMGAEAMENAKASSNIISEENLRRANEFRVKMDQMKEGATKLFHEFALNLLPIFEKLWAWVEPHIPKIKAFFEVAFEIIKYLIVDVLIPAILRFIETLRNWYLNNKETIDQIVAKFMELKDRLVVFWKMLTNLFNGNGTALTSIVKFIFNTIVNIITTTINLILDTINLVLAILTGDWKGAWESIKNIVQTILKFIGNNIKNVLNLWLGIFGTSLSEIYNTVVGKFNAVRDWLSRTLDNIKEKFSSVGASIKNAFSSAFSGIANAVKSSVNMVVTYVNKMISGLTNAINTVSRLASVIPGVNIPRISAPQIPKLARGGTITSAGRVMVGEQGPEYLDLPRGAKVTPLDKGGITINITGNTIMNERDADRLGDIVVKRLTQLGIATT